MNKDINKAIKVLKEGGVILYPTDTIWGIGCDATTAGAIEKVYSIKKRDEDKSMIILVDHAGRIERYVDDMPEVAWDLAEVSDKPLTIIYSNAINLPENLISRDGSIGIRVVKDAFCQKLISRFNRPIVSTSANFSNMHPPENFSEIDEEIIKSVDYVVKWRQQEKKKSKPSGIIKLTPDGQVKIIRE
ncbi:MAG: L-threonylcarbamoyladenylate synthase [Bacteroidales bacterium]